MRAGVGHYHRTRSKIRTFDKGAGALAGSVLRGLRNIHDVDMCTQMELIQGTVAALRERGFGVMLHTADGANLREQVSHVD